MPFPSDKRRPNLDETVEPLNARLQIRVVYKRTKSYKFHTFRLKDKRCIGYERRDCMKFGNFVHFLAQCRSVCERESTPCDLYPRFNLSNFC